MNGCFNCNRLRSYILLVFFKAPRWRLFAKKLASSLVFIAVVGSPAAAESRLSVPGVIPGIIGDDDRRLVRTTEHPWHAIGRVNNTLGPFCTGTLIGPRRVLTAAHCLWNSRAGRWLPPCAIHFLAGYRGGKYLTHARVASFELAGRKVRAKHPPRTPAQDWAVLILAEDVSASAQALPTASLDSSLVKTYRQPGATILQAGYSRDRPHILTMNPACNLIGFKEGDHVVLHNCDATFGDSGSPILLKRGNTFHIIGLLVGIERASGKGIGASGAAFHSTLEKMAPPAPHDGRPHAC